MQVFKNKSFDRWAKKEGLGDDVLRQAVIEMARGLVDAELGGQIYKKRIAVPGRGKRGGIRTLLVYRAGSRAFFVYGFAKNQRANVSADELKALKLLAKELLGMTKAELTQAIEHGALVEITLNV